MRYLLVDLFVSRFVVRVNGNQTKITVTILPLDDRNVVMQLFPNFFQVGTTFISQNVLRTTLLLSPLKANYLRFSTTVCDT
jgi:hypothetical protein